MVMCQKICSTGDQHGNIRVWDLTANACSCELVPEVGTPVRSLTVAQDASLVIAANNQGACLTFLATFSRLLLRNFYCRAHIHSPPGIGKLPAKGKALAGLQFEETMRCWTKSRQGPPGLLHFARQSRKQQRRRHTSHGNLAEVCHNWSLQALSHEFVSRDLLCVENDARRFIYHAFWAFA